jgi:hypothetical protein
LWFGETLTALLAFETLDLVPSVKTCLDHLDPAVVTRHFEPVFSNQGMSLEIANLLLTFNT